MTARSIRRATLSSGRAAEHQTGRGGPQDVSCGPPLPVCRGPGRCARALPPFRQASNRVSVTRDTRLTQAHPRLSSTRRHAAPVRPATTRSSRWMTSAGVPGGRSADRRPAAARTAAASIVTRPFANTRPVLADHLDRALGVERALDVADTRREQRPALRDERSPRAVVDDDPAGGADRERDPELAARQPLGCGRRPRCPPPRPARASVITPGAPAAAITARTPDHDGDLRRGELRSPSRRSPAPTRRRPRRGSSASSTAAISSISDASASRRGSAVKRPAVSVSSTSTSARTMFATSAAMRSLSPNRISSSATVSFSLTIGITPSSSSRRERLACVQVLRAVHEVVRRDAAPGRRRRRASARIAPNRSISRGWPTAAIACSVLDVGRPLREPERGHPRGDRARAHQRAP